MDNTIDYILVKDSFGKIATKPYPKSYPIKLFKNPEYKYNQYLAKKISINGNPAAIFCNSSSYEKLQSLKNLFGGESPEEVNIFNKARMNSNPFERIGNSIFINRAAIKLANIDAIFKISGDTFDFLNQHSNFPLQFCDIAAGPGGFTQYLQYRYPNSKGVGMTLKNELDWDRNAVDTEKFEIDYGPTRDGDLYKNWNYFKEKLRNNYNIQLMTADGGIETEEYEKQEFVSSRILICQAVVATEVVENGTFILKVFDTVTKFSADVIYCLSLCFEQIVLFKPCSSRPANSERYLICYKRKENIKYSDKLLSKACKEFTDESFLESFLGELPDDFKTWLTLSNDDDISSQIFFAERILEKMIDKENKEIKVNLNKALLYWNLPDNNLTYRKGQIFKGGQTNINI